MISLCIHPSSSHLLLGNLHLLFEAELCLLNILWSLWRSQPYTEAYSILKGAGRRIVLKKSCHLPDNNPGGQQLEVQRVHLLQETGALAMTKQMSNGKGDTPTCQAMPFSSCLFLSQLFCLPWKAICKG